MALQKKDVELAVLSHLNKQKEEAENNLNLIYSKRAHQEEILADGTIMEVKVLKGIESIDILSEVATKTLRSIVDLAFSSELAYVGKYGPAITDKRRAQIDQAVDKVGNSYKDLKSILKESITDIQATFEAVADELSKELDDFLTGIKTDQQQKQDSLRMQKNLADMQKQMDVDRKEIDRLRAQKEVDQAQMEKYKAQIKQMQDRLNDTITDEKRQSSDSGLESVKEETKASMMVEEEETKASPENDKVKLELEIGDYYGDAKDGEPHGNGTLTFKLGNADLRLKYEGQWMKGLKHGKGTQTWVDGASYVGDWNEGERHGFGKYSNLQGEAYTGQWENDKHHGVGKLKLKAGEQYKGEFKNSVLDGVGIYTWPNGDVYKGTQKAFKKHGYGEKREAQGTFKGYFWKGKIHGLARFTGNDGFAQCRLYEKGELRKEFDDALKLAVQEGWVDYRMFFADDDSREMVFPDEKFEAPQGFTEQLAKVKEQLKSLGLD